MCLVNIHAGGGRLTSSLPPWWGAKRTPTPTARVGETILLVEDDAAVRATSVENLRDLGYRVVSSRDAAEALRLIESDPSIKLMFTDVGLPGAKTGDSWLTPPASAART